MDKNKFNVLFLCTGNSARSIMAEALLKRWGANKFNVYSAGSMPKGKVHPKTLEILDKNNFKTENFSSKSWNEFTSENSPEIDFIITVCSNAANETCPVFPGRSISAHWDIDDPAREFETESEQERAFLKAFMELDQRIQIFTNLPIEKLDEMALREHMDKMSDPK